MEFFISKRPYLKSLLIFARACLIAKGFSTGPRMDKDVGSGSDGTADICLVMRHDILCFVGRASDL
jgi:hypothetical protein